MRYWLIQAPDELWDVMQDQELPLIRQIFFTFFGGFKALAFYFALNLYLCINPILWPTQFDLRVHLTLALISILFYVYRGVKTFGWRKTIGSLAVISIVSVTATGLMAVQEVKNVDCLL